MPPPLSALLAPLEPQPLLLLLLLGVLLLLLLLRPLPLSLRCRHSSTLAGTTAPGTRCRSACGTSCSGSAS